MEKNCEACGKAFFFQSGYFKNCDDCRSRVLARKQKSRAREKVESEVEARAQLAKEAISFWEYVDNAPKAKLQEISVTNKEYTEKIRAELGRLNPDDDYSISDCVYITKGFENNFIKKISDPFGILIATVFTDAAINNVVNHVHKQPDILKSATFQELYKRFLRVAAENPVAAQQLAEWFKTQGTGGRLVNTGDQYFENSTKLLIELRGRPVDSQRIHEATGRISYRPGPGLHYVPVPRTVDPRQHKDDGSGFLGRDVNLSAADRARLTRPPEKVDPQPTEREQVDAVERTFRDLTTELLRYGRHSEQAAIKEVYDRYVNAGASWRQVHGECNKLVNEFKKRAAVSGTFR